MATDCEGNDIACKHGGNDIDNGRGIYSCSLSSWRGNGYPQARGMEGEENLTPTFFLENQKYTMEAAMTTWCCSCGARLDVDLREAKFERTDREPEDGEVYAVCMNGECMKEGKGEWETVLKGRCAGQTVPALARVWYVRMAGKKGA